MSVLFNLQRLFDRKLIKKKKRCDYYFLLLEVRNLTKYLKKQIMAGKRKFLYFDLVSLRESAVTY